MWWKYGMSRGELSSVKNAVGLEALADPKHPDYPLFQHLAYDQDKLDRLSGGPDHAAHPHRAKRQAGHGGLLSRGVGRLGVNSPLYGTQVPVC